MLMIIVWCGTAYWLIDISHIPDPLLLVICFGYGYDILGITYWLIDWSILVGWSRSFNRNHLASPPRFVLGKSPCKISWSEVIRTGKSSYFANQKAHRQFKDSFDGVKSILVMNSTMYGLQCLLKTFPCQRSFFLTSWHGKHIEKATCRSLLPSRWAWEG